jgi:endonuclease YncB( thermonuclease family)
MAAWRHDLSPLTSGRLAGGQVTTAAIVCHDETMLRVIFILMLLIGPAAAQGQVPLPAEKNARVISVYDGDTLRAVASVWLGTEITTSVRLRGIDTPEMRGKCAAEKARAIAARDALLELAPVGSVVVLTDIAPDKYQGRIVARVLLPDGRDVSTILLAAGHARAYDGGRRSGWC